ncbi:hypothetical protein JM16_008688 [Phytophthora kernoviae]|uniref:Uncharacterized protein n=1 Tax=Phytophthora kernoviae TaxID=325452 RepID=A0A8T0LL72_9STRA|nr:hypothetical protein JM16_008688 [Phytophthora kernoviae]
MEWMAADFAQERKWRVRNAKMLSQALVSHLDRQEARLARMKKSEEVARRRAAARVGRDVKKFWSKIDKIIAFKVKLQADEMKQRHMQKHLTQLVEQTEKYSSALAASFQETEVITQEEIREQEKGDDSDFEMGEEEVDDESTIEADERITTRAEVDEELVLLQEEGELTVQELRESMCERRINGILADEMGLGKTIQTISLLAHLACNQGLWGPHLIVVPTSCLVNWEMEFKRWCPAFKVLTYYGSAKRRKELRQGWSKQNAFQVCITSYQLVVQDAHCFKRKKCSQRRLLLTGTPLQNNLLELWALMHFLMPHVFASRKEFSYWFQNPLALIVENGGETKEQLADGTVASSGGKDLVTQLHGIIRPFVLRRLKKDVAKQLPGKFEHVITCQLSKRQRFLYEDFISRSSTRRAMYGRGKGRGANFMSMMNVLMQLRKVCNHPDLFEPRPISSPLDMPSLHLQQLAVLLRTLKRGGHRCLIFTQMSSMLNILEVFLNLHGHTYFRLDGATKVDKRQMLMERFNRDEKIFCFILSTRSGGLGINLTGADAVIFYDSDWNPAMDAQAQDRAHRIGQTRDVHIYRLVSEHTVEENILRKAQQKRHLDFLVMSEGQFTTDFFSKASLRELMTGSAGEGEHEEIESETDREDEGEYTDEDMDGDTGEMSLDAVESAMAQLEDEEDVVAMKGARAEFMQEQQEFDEESGGKHGDKIREKARDAAEEQKLQAWKASVSSLQGFEDSLNSVDRYALHFREDVDPLYAYTPAQQAAVLAGIESNPSTPTLLQDIERIDIEKQEEEARLIAEGELVVGRLEDNDDTSTEGMTQYYNQLYRRERAHVLFERRKRLLTGAAWTVMKCANTGKPFYFNADTREATWDRPAVWTSNEQIKNARERGFGGLPGVALLRVLSMLTPTPERYHSQMVCRSWHRAAQHNSLFVKVNASDFDASSSTSLAQVLSRVASGDTVLFGAGVYQLEDVLEISKPVRLLAMPDSHVELQMHSGPTANCEAKNTVKSSRKKKRSVLEKEYALGNWQHLLSVVGDGRLRVEYCELDGNGLGNACICVWGRGEKKRKHKRIESEDTKAIATTAVPGATTTKAGSTTRCRDTQCRNQCTKCILQKLSGYQWRCIVSGKVVNGCNTFSTTYRSFY